MFYRILVGRPIVLCKAKSEGKSIFDESINKLPNYINLLLTAVMGREIPKIILLVINWKMKKGDTD